MPSTLRRIALGLGAGFALGGAANATVLECTGSTGSVQMGSSFYKIENNNIYFWVAAESRWLPMCFTSNRCEFSDSVIKQGSRFEGGSPMGALTINRMTGAYTNSLYGQDGTSVTVSGSCKVGADPSANQKQQF